MANWRTFVDYEIEVIDYETGEITKKFIGQKEFKRNYEKIPNNQRTEINHEHRTKRIIYGCRKQRQLKLF